jgi:hypothetical protein
MVVQIIHEVYHPITSLSRFLGHVNLGSWGLVRSPSRVHFLSPTILTERNYDTQAHMISCPPGAVHCSSRSDDHSALIVKSPPKAHGLSVAEACVAVALKKTGACFPSRASCCILPGVESEKLGLYRWIENLGKPVLFQPQTWQLAVEENWFPDSEEQVAASIQKLSFHKVGIYVARSPPKHLLPSYKIGIDSRQPFLHANGRLNHAAS